ncbi:NADH dehydrogenase ubiquinone Fe-S protein 4 [Leisingera aquaemixtae]|uniref:ETC complex I subunit conserved region n=1 Tax=Leisingera aquaemixtae TaxID=1396826 RepID=A0A0P1HDT2_9RHOB|nr:NADH dehydrogenase ubiquinone Fe-S protein 4 [Leisingera aquaemixtae]CUI01789.1 hypothetical protein PHA8399_03936 [Leisingera aquaemixtae]
MRDHANEHDTDPQQSNMLPHPPRDHGGTARASQCRLTPLPDGEVRHDAPIAFVYRPARNPMQSGPRPKRWMLQLEPTRPLEIEPLMGWTSGNDPARQIRMPFSSREAAIEFAEAQGWRVYVLPDHDRKPVIKSYRDRIVAKPEPLRRDAGKKAIRQEFAPTRSTEEKASSSQDSSTELLDEMLEETFPASDPLPLWSGRIGPPSNSAGATA